MKYSVVIPIYNSSGTLKELCRRIDAVFLDLDAPYEIIMVDDGSQDESWQVMEKIQKENPNVKIIQLMKNFGQHNAILCGLGYISGDFVITIDDDLQNPPEEIPKLIKRIGQEYDAVFGALRKKKDTKFKTLASKIIQRFNVFIFKKPKHLKVSSFRIFTRELCDQIKQFKTPYPYITGMILSLTDNIENITVEHDKRKYGKSTYKISKLFKLAFNLVINYTSLPLIALSIIGFLTSGLSFAFGIYIIIKKILIGVSVEGWTSIIVLLSFFNGLLISILSLMGEYLYRIIGEVSNRSQFAIRRKKI